MREDLTLIAVVLDKSSSMNSVREETIAGFNSFIEEQKRAPGQAVFTLTTFADSVDISPSVPLESVEPLTRQSYSPHGNTALYDAIGGTIDRVGAQLHCMPEADRPGRVLIMIQTDGHENVSRRYSKPKIAEMIKHQRDKYSWHFSFIGADLTAVEDAQALNIPAGFTMQYAATPAGTAQVLRSVGVAVSNYRGTSTNQLNVEAQSMDFFSATRGDTQGAQK